MFKRVSHWFEAKILQAENNIIKNQKGPQWLRSWAWSDFKRRLLEDLMTFHVSPRFRKCFEQETFSHEFPVQLMRWFPLEPAVLTTDLTVPIGFNAKLLGYDFTTDADLLALLLALDHQRIIVLDHISGNLYGSIVRRAPHLTDEVLNAYEDKIKARSQTQIKGFTEEKGA